MEDQNKKNCGLYDCNQKDKKEMHKLIDYFMCRLRRSLLLVVGIYMLLNFLFAFFTIVLSRSIQTDFRANVSELKKVAFDRKKQNSNNPEANEPSNNSKEQDETSPWKEKDLEAIKESSISVEDSLI